MPIKWSALKVSEAADMIEGYITQAAEPLEQAKIVALEARKIANLPGYMDDDFVGFKWDIERFLERLNGRIGSARKSIPSEALEAEQARLKDGTIQKLM